MVTSREYITDILEVCLERLRAGDSVAACLQAYSHYADELAPLLHSAEYARRASPPQLNPAARLAIQRQLRSTVAGRASQRRAATSWYQIPVLRFGALLVAITLAIGSSAVGVAAAQSSLPGSPLYSVKRAGERLRLTLTTSPDQRAMLHMDFAQARLLETLTLLDSQQPADEHVLDDLAREYDLAWANIQLLPAEQAQAQRERLIAEGQVEVVALTKALGRAPNANRSAIEATLRSNQATLIQATEKNRPTLPTPPAGDNPPAPRRDAPPGDDQGSQPEPTKAPAIDPGRGRGPANGTGQPANPGNGQDNSGSDHSTPGPTNPPDKPGNSGQGGGDGQGQNQDPGTGQDGGNGQGQNQDHGNGQGNGNGQGQNHDPNTGQSNGGSDSESPDPANQPDKPGDSDQNGGNGNSPDDKSKDNGKSNGKDKDTKGEYP